MTAQSDDEPSVNALFEIVLSDFIEYAKGGEFHFAFEKGHAAA